MHIKDGVALSDAADATVAITIENHRHWARVRAGSEFDTIFCRHGQPQPLSEGWAWLMRALPRKRAFMSPSSAAGWMLSRVQKTGFSRSFVAVLLAWLPRRLGLAISDRINAGHRRIVDSTFRDLTAYS
ncbi:hypothetical protein E4U53_000397 [Claviceps sorghi]|nr:hypothetical protein E4U53_000397 [Claviceps sorghi]